MINDDCEMFRLGLSQSELEKYKQDEATENKYIREVFSEAQRRAKRADCFFCKKQSSSFCNSHSVPRFCLKRIADKGKVYFSGIQTLVPFFGEDSGLNNAGTFRLICRNCDGKIFQEYENPSTFGKYPTEKVLAEIALKNYLHIISKRLQEKELYTLLCEKRPKTSNVVAERLKVILLDLAESESAYNRAKMAATGNHDFFYLCYYKKLDYVVPIASQGIFTLVSDFDDNVINDLYNLSPSYRTEDIHIAVFPLEKTSVIIAFVDIKSKRYRQFYKQLNKLPEKDQLAAINYIIFSYSENVFISKQVDEKVLKNRAFLDVCQKSVDVISFSPFHDPLRKAVEEYSLSKRDTIPNLLSREHQLRPKAQTEQDN